MSETKVLLVANTVIRRRTITRPAEHGRPAKTKAEDIRAGHTFEATEDEANELTRGANPAARRANLDEQAKAKGGEKGKQPGDDDGDGLEKKTVAELKAIVADRGITLPPEANTKAEIIAEIRKAGPKA